MRKMIVGSALAIWFLAIGLTAADPVLKLADIKDFFLMGDCYIGGQPTLETLRWLKAQGVSLVVNIRSEAENKEFAAMAFSEENIVKELGLAYYSLPVGEKESFSPKTVNRLAELLKVKEGKALLHCAAAGRATTLWMAYLVCYRGYPLSEAVAVGKQMKFTFPLEDYLGGKFTWKWEAVKQ